MERETQNPTIIHSHMFEENPDDDEQIYNLTDTMDSNMARHHHHHHHWAGFLINNKVHQGPGPSKEFNVPTTSIHHHHQFYQHDFTGIPITSNRGFMVHMDDHASIPYEENVDLRTSQARGLSLSLSSSNHMRFVEGHAYIRNSKYLGPAKDLLHETCNLADDNISDILNLHRNRNLQNDRQDDVKDQSIRSLDLLQLQIRKTKLVQLLQELDRRYNHYRNQMKAVVQSFEAVAGNGAAKVYSSMASRVMSRHFRCLKDSIFAQIKVTKKAIDDKNDTTVTGGNKGETPRLRLLDQKFRQQKALQQMASMEAHPWRPQRGLPERSVSVLRAWLFEHFLHPYPSDVDKHILSRQTGLSRSQVSNWFINARVRLWKPMVEEMYSAEVKETDDQSRSTDAALDPTVRKDTDTLSSIVVNKTPKFGEAAASYGGEIDFSSYGGGVSLTLGLHHRDERDGMRLEFSPPSSSSSYFQNVEDPQYSSSFLDSQNLSYRNMMGAQLLHDLGG